MITRFRIALIVAVAALSLATLHARQQPAAAPEVFCNTMQAGALCPTATVSILKLSGANVQKWLDAVGKYQRRRGKRDASAEGRHQGSSDAGADVRARSLDGQGHQPRGEQDPRVPHRVPLTQCVPRSKGPRRSRESSTAGPVAGFPRPSSAPTPHVTKMAPARRAGRPLPAPPAPKNALDSNLSGTFELYQTMKVALDEDQDLLTILDERFSFSCPAAS